MIVNCVLTADAANIGIHIGFLKKYRAHALNIHPSSAHLLIYSLVFRGIFFKVINIDSFGI